MKSILIDILSNSIGDNIAAIPYVSEYQKKHNITVFCKLNPILIPFVKDIYSNINFIDNLNNIYFDEKISLEYIFFKSIQGGYAEQLGFENPKYLRPKISISIGDRPIKNKYVTLGIHSTSQLKYWNHSLGVKSQPISPNWEELCSQLRKKGYTPVVVEKNESFGSPPYFNYVPYKSNKKIGQSLSDSLNIIYHSEFYIGLSSGISWLSHAMGKKVAMISNFTEDWNEFDLQLDDYIRITNKSVCHGCWNKINIEHSYDPSDWYWCPKHRETERQFECHTSISVDSVVDAINKWL